jgi:pectate lyase
MIRFIRPIILLAFFACVIPAEAQDGFCMVNGTTTGGTGGTTVAVTNGTDFNTQINIAGARIIQVQGVVSISRVFPAANKTIIGLDTNATLLGNINVSDTTNVIIRNLRITSPANDGLTIWNAQHVWIDHCTLYDTGDGLCDMNRGSQYVTVSWCKFHYSAAQMEHRFTMIADGYNNDAGTNYGYYTLHHNWWSARADQRMPASSYGRIHMYNNYFNCTNNSYCSNARNETQILSVSNYYAGVKSPLYADAGSTGLIRTMGNIYSGTSGNAPAPGTDTLGPDLDPPPYAYVADAAADVPSIVMAGAGAPGPDTMPIPPKSGTAPVPTQIGAQRTTGC